MLAQVRQLDSHNTAPCHVKRFVHTRHKKPRRDIAGSAFANPKGDHFERLDPASRIAVIHTQSAAEDICCKPLERVVLFGK